ncbi:MAG TPA: efflux RND transporter periplasmic adaptor subunit [Vicinamibacteria bacterium]|nr:efflux RND transporter periplasmic adaptor subunit [Vicinamibacteria bacterium]
MTKVVLPFLSALMLFAGCHGESRPGPAARAPQGEAWLPPAQVHDAGMRVEAVDEASVDDTIVTGGRVTFDDTRVSHVFSPVMGRIVKVLAPLGARVTPGTPLAVLSSPDLAQAASDALKADADLTAATRERARQQELFAAHAGAQRDLETAEDNYRRALAERDRAREKVRLLAPRGADAVSQEYLLRAPIAGEVIARNANPGTEVQGQYSGGTAVELFTVGSLDQVWVLGDVYEADLARVHVGAPVTVSVVSHPGRSFGGQVDWVSDALDPQSRTAHVRVVIENGDGALRPEMFATLSISVNGRQALAVPRTAVLRLGEQTVAFVETGRTPDGRLRFQRREVKVDEGPAGDRVAVLAGLAAGERVVTSGAILLAGLI